MRAHTYILRRLVVGQAIFVQVKMPWLYQMYNVLLFYENELRSLLQFWLYESLAELYCQTVKVYLDEMQWPNALWVSSYNYHDTLKVLTCYRC